jgi:hypothetical protein
MTTSPEYAAPSTAGGDPVDGKRIVRTVLLCFGVLGAVIIASFLGVSWAINVHLEKPWLLAALVGAALILVLVPVIVFAVSSNWAYASSTEGARVFRRVVFWMSAVQLISLATVIALGIDTKPPLWIVITLVVCGVVFAPVGILLGKLFRSTLSVVPLVALDHWTPSGVGKRDPVPYIAVGVFVVIAVLAVLALQPWNFSRLDPRELKFAFAGVCFALDFASLGAMIVCLGRVISTAAALRAVVSKDYLQARRIRRAIYRHRMSELEPIDVERARATASLSVPQLRWLIPFECLLFVSLSLSQASSLIVTSFSVSWWFLGFVLLAGLVVVVILATRVAALRRYLAALPSAVPAAAL